MGTELIFILEYLPLNKFKSSDTPSHKLTVKMHSQDFKISSEPIISSQFNFKDIY